MRLDQLPLHATVFVDANCFIYHFLATVPSCTQFFHRAFRGEVTALTSTHVVAEVHHRLMVADITTQLARPPRNIPAYLRRHPEIIRLLRRCEEALDQLSRFRISVLPITVSLLDAARRISHQFGLLTNDALIVAVIRAHRITHLASNDADFTRVTGLTLWRP